MKIVFMTNAMGKGGAERVIVNLTSYLSEKNEVSIISVHNTYVGYDIDKKVNLYTLDDEYTDIYSTEKSIEKISMIKKIKRIFKRLTKINYYKKSLKPDVIVSFMPKPSFLVLITNFINKIPVIVSVRNDPKTEYASKKNNILMKILYPSAAGFVFQTEEAKNYFNKKIKDKAVVIPNPINPKFIEKPFLEERQKEIVSVGRLEEQKNHKLLIDAFSEVVKKYGDYKLIIYGEGKLRKNLEDYINEKELQGKVFLPGNVDNIKDRIYESSMFVLSSNYEGMPNALMEAMALGLPVISTDCPCGGPRFLIQNNKNGILVENGNVEELENAMKKILENPDFASELGKNANKIAETLNPNKVNAVWEKYIKKVIDKK